MKNKTPRIWPKRLASNWPVTGVFALCLLITAFAFFMYQQGAWKATLSKASEEAKEHARTLQDGLEGYVNLNRHVAAFFAASRNVAPSEFDRYIKTLNALETHPGLANIGYVPRILNSGIAEFEAAVRKTHPFYKIHGTRQDAAFVYPYLYTALKTERARNLLGLDYSTIPERWEAMQKARDLGVSVATAKHAAAKDPLYRPVVLVFTPVYDLDRPIDTVEQRRAALNGFVFSVFYLEDMIERIMGARFMQAFDLEIYASSGNYQGMLTRQYLVYDGDNQAHALSADEYPLAHLGMADFARSDWSLYFFPKPHYFRHTDNQAALSVLIPLAGVLASIMLSFLTWKWQKHLRAKRLQLEQGQRFQAVFENHAAGVYSLDLQRRFINANAKVLAELEVTKDKLIGSSVEQFIAPEHAEGAREKFQEASNGNAVTYDSAVITATGKRVDTSIMLIPISIEGKIHSLLGIAQNITAQRQAERALKESRQMLQLVLDNIPQRVYWKDIESVFLGCNKKFCEDAGVSHAHEIIGKTDSDFLWRANAELYRRADREIMQSGIAKINYEEPLPRKDGGQNWLRSSKIPLTNAEGETIGVLGLSEDITERKLLEQKLEQMAHYDVLTGLPNRAFFYDQLGQAISRSKRHGSLLGLMYFDIDKFKLINDTYGHDVGDTVITQFAKRVKSMVREIDIVGRLGGDEFCLIVEDLSDRQAAEVIATKLIAAMRPVLQIGERALQISTSIGISFYEPWMEPDELIRKADHAMYQAKQSGRNRFETAAQR